MYVTRPLSLYQKSSDSNALLAQPLEGPNSGYLVIQDDDPTMPSCFGKSNKSLSIEELPLPSNKVIHFQFSDDGHDFLAVPVINQPLSSNRYYAIKVHGNHKGEAYTCSKEEDKGVSCGKSYIQNVKPRPLDPKDVYQQFEFDHSTKVTCSATRGFKVKSIASDGHVPTFLKKGSPIHIQISNSNCNDFIMKEAKGLNNALRKHLPDFNFPLSRAFSNPICIGKWYVPFMFVQEGNLRDQVKESMYYEMTLEQRWERIFAIDSTYNQGNSKVIMDVVVPILEVAIGGKDGVLDESNLDNKVVWFKTIGSVMGEQMSVGLNRLVVERMIWEEERIGWVNGKQRQVRIVKEEEYGGIGWWAKFGCYVLVERFVLKRMDGSLVLTCDFKHTRQVKTKWE